MSQVADWDWGAVATGWSEVTLLEWAMGPGFALES